MHGFGDFVFGFWWLIFPLMGFVFGGYSMFLQHQRSKQAMEVLKAYAQQGKDPPPEVMAAVTGVHTGVTPPPPGAPYPGNPYNSPYGPGYGGPGYGGWGGPWGGGWGWGRWGWRGPMWAWSRVVTFAAICIGFTFAGQYYGGGDGDAVKAFNLVAIIMGALAVGFGFMALMHTLFYRDAPRP